MLPLWKLIGITTCSILTYLCFARCFATTGAQPASTTSAVATQRKLLASQGLFDGLNAAKKVGDALGSQVRRNFVLGHALFCFPQLQ
jgi:hypothetical protein